MNTEQRRDSWPHSRSVEKLKELILNQRLTERTRLLGSSYVKYSGSLLKPLEIQKCLL